jgi:hypothetical protein
MTESPMLNRSLAFLKPKQPFFAWLKSLPDRTKLTPEECCEDAAVYLIPYFEDDEERESIVKEFYGALFWEVLPNLRVSTGGAVYGKPTVQRVIEVR